MESAGASSRAVGEVELRLLVGMGKAELRLSPEGHGLQDLIRFTVVPHPVHTNGRTHVLPSLCWEGVWLYSHD